jgi:hypothetical protein
MIHFYDNPVADIISDYISFDEIKQQVATLNQFRHLFYSIKYKTQFRYWLYHRVRLPKIVKKYHPTNLMMLLEDTNADLDEVLDMWTHEM